MEPNTMESTSTNNSYEQISKDLEEGLAENKKCIDKVLEMRVRISESELEMCALMDPEFLLNVVSCKAACAKCEELIDSIEDVQESHSSTKC